jgi:AraC family transcriptional activator of pobA
MNPRSGKKTDLPTYDFFKRLNTPLSVEYSKLEKAYNIYDSSHAHRHDYYEILLFDKSGGTHEIDFISYPVKKHSLHFLSPGQVHLLRRNKDVTGHVLAFKEEALLSVPFIGQELMLPSSAISPVVELKKRQKENIYDSLRKVIEEYNKESEYKKFSLCASLILFLVEMISSFESRIQEHPEKSGTSGRQNKLYHNFRRLVDSGFIDNHSVSDYANKLHVTPGHLNDTVKRESGKSASEIIHERMILESKRLLYHSDLSIKEIATKLNYEDPAYFNRFFKKHEGVTPVVFRETIRSKYDGNCIV